MELSISMVAYLLVFFVLVKALDVAVRGSRRSNRSKLPPGPKPLPIIGNLLDLGVERHKSLAMLAETYGPLMSLKEGSITTIVISSAELAKDVLHKHNSVFSNKTVLDVVNAENHSQISMAWLPVSPAWRNLKRVCNSYLFTSQKLDSSQELRNGKIQKLIAEVQESCAAGETVDIRELVSKAVFNSLSNAVFSLSLTDSRSDIPWEFKKIVDCIMGEIGKSNLSDYFPILRKFDPQGIRQRASVLFGKLLDIFDQIIVERLLLRKSESYTTENDILDALLTVCEQNKEDMNKSIIKHLLIDVFAAGHTAYSTAESAMTELLQNPNSLRRARSELEQTVGRGKFLQESDIDRLPYLQAVIKETLRLHPPSPLLIPHKAEIDIEIQGFTIPKDAQVLVNVWAIGRDPNSWEDPDSFTPERFLNSDIDVRGHDFQLIPFGAGSRMCPGLPMATRMLPMIVGSLIHSFDWKVEDGVEPLRALPIQVK